ncbi:hypothetical protein KI387_037219, partial [Taxus chinensis]
VVEAMVDDMTTEGLNFTEEAFKTNEKVINLQKKLTSSIKAMEKEMKVWSG